IVRCSHILASHWRPRDLPSFPTRRSSDLSAGGTRCSSSSTSRRSPGRCPCGAGRPPGSRQACSPGRPGRRPIRRPDSRAAGTGSRHRRVRQSRRPHRRRRRPKVIDMDSSTVATFEAGRDRLASLAYRLLGSAADAEDTVQDAFLRWQVADREHIEVPEAWLTKVVTNLALDRLRSARTRRERAAGAWLPEPLLDGDPMLGPADTVEQRESVTLAVLLLLEQLSPVERAAYVLREAFAYRHSEIAEILGITESA